MTHRRAPRTFRQLSLDRMWADRANKIRVAIDSANRCGKRSLSTMDLAWTIRIPTSSIQRIGRTMIDKCQVEGVVVEYMAGLFVWRRPDIKAVD